jgi:hypothetical protein
MLVCRGLLKSYLLGLEWIKVYLTAMSSRDSLGQGPEESLGGLIGGSASRPKHRSEKKVEKGGVPDEVELQPELSPDELRYPPIG